MANPKFLQDEKFLSKLKEKYNSSKQGGGEASFRVLYYGGAAGSVPFMWESQPGTPKHKFSDGPLPPLTPPPSYQFSSPGANPKSGKKHNSRNSKIFNSIFPSKKINASPTASFSPPSSSPSFSSSSYSLPSTPFNARKGNFKARSGPTVSFGLDEDEFEPGAKSPISTLCFRPRKESPTRRFKSVKNVVLSIVGGN